MLVRRNVAALAAFLVVSVSYVADLHAQRAAAVGPTLPLVILVRHAEKAAAPADDPSLTPEGAERAKALDRALASVGVTAIVTSEFKRTRETAAPLAARLKLTPETVAARGSAAEAHAQAVAAAVRNHSGGVVLVVGHSNTVPAIIAALGGERMRDICDADYANLFMLTQNGSVVSLVRSRYGLADKSEATPGVCAPMGGGF
jgi:broad specificity phosphatase PhoE